MTSQPGHCDGECFEHQVCSGEWHIVRVSGNLDYIYCDGAIEGDRRRGYTVEIEDDE